MVGTALQNYKLWKEDCLNPALEPAAGFHAHGGTFAVLDCDEYQRLSHKKPLDPCWDVVVSEYLDPKRVDTRVKRPLKALLSSTHALDTLKQGKTKKLAQFFSRLAMALFGGLALIVPMLIMSLHQSRLTALVTTSVFVIAVGAILAWWMDDAQDKDIVAATAAYAAVLVVFVGVSLTPTT